MKRCFNMSSCFGINKKSKTPVPTNIEVDSTKELEGASNVQETSNTQPENAIHLGGVNFLSVAQFLGQTRVHIRKYIPDKDGIFQPTREGVSIPPVVWDSLSKNLDEFTGFSQLEKMIVYDKDLCVSRNLSDKGQLTTFQRLFQRKNLSFQFVSENISLSFLEFQKLCSSVDTVSEKVKKSLIKYTLPYLLNQELINLKQEENEMMVYISVSDLQESLAKCISDALGIKILEITDCFGCQKEAENPLFQHNCARTRVDKFEDYFQRALFLLNWRDIAKDFLRRNNNVDFNILFNDYGFIDLIDVNKLYDAVESLYIENSHCENDSMLTL